MLGSVKDEVKIIKSGKYISNSLSLAISQFDFIFYGRVYICCVFLIAILLIVYFISFHFIFCLVFVLYRQLRMRTHDFERIGDSIQYVDCLRAIYRLIFLWIGFHLFWMWKKNRIYSCEKIIWCAIKKIFHLILD